MSFKNAGTRFGIQECDYCNGTGLLPLEDSMLDKDDEEDNLLPVDYIISNEEYREMSCHACNGKGSIVDSHSYMMDI